MFPIINYKINFINIIQLNNSNKKNFFYLKYNYKIIYFLRILKKLTIVNNYLIIKKNNNLFFKIIPYYFKGIKTFKKFKTISTVKKKIYISLKGLNLLNKRAGSSLYLLSTNRGLIFHNKAIEKNISGLLLGVFVN